MKVIAQEDLLGCGVACAAFVLQKNYQQTLKLFPSGKKKAGVIGFYCREIVEVLIKEGLQYMFAYVKPHSRKTIYTEGAIVFIRKSPKYPGGHYICYTNGMWMDPWINFP